MACCLQASHVRTLHDIVIVNSTLMYYDGIVHGQSRSGFALHNQPILILPFQLVGAGRA
jgi:hypothetical protein